MLSVCNCKEKCNAVSMCLRTPSLKVYNIQDKSLWAVCFLAISVPTILDSGDNSCEHSYKNLSFFRVTFQRAAVRNIQGGTH